MIKLCTKLHNVVIVKASTIQACHVHRDPLTSCLLITEPVHTSFSISMSSTASGHAIMFCPLLKWFFRFVCVLPLKIPKCSHLFLDSPGPKWPHMQTWNSLEQTKCDNHFVHWPDVCCIVEPLTTQISTRTSGHLTKFQHIIVPLKQGHVTNQWCPY